MIISDITGGLGNQMFQYAMGRALALKSAQTLRLDTCSFNRHPQHQGFELNRVFKLSAQVATSADINLLLGWQSSRNVRRFLIRTGLSRFSRKAHVVEPHFHYWSEIEKLSRPCYLSGYWQSAKYFQNFSAEIRQDFWFKPPLAGRNLEIAKQISGVDSISLHVRRGDYVNNPGANATHGVCSPNYYHEAISYISDRVVDPHIFIFSDDIPWVKENLNINIPCSFIDHNRGLESFNDMRLMSMCRHHIIANSSFSWWGAWLGQGETKIVVAPGKWFAINKSVVDLIPDNWVRL